VPSGARRTPSVAERLADDLAGLGYAVEPEPPPIASGEHLLFPDLALDREGTRWFIEVLGFSTKEYLATKLARYQRAGISAVALCIDLSNAPGCELSAHVCSFRKHVDVDDLLEIVRAGP